MTENNQLYQENIISTPPLSSPELVAELLQQALACLNENRFNAAVAIYQRVLALEPDNIYAGFNLGVIRHGHGELAEAIACYETVLAKKPDNVELLCRLANAYREHGRWDRAIATCRLALKGDGNLADMHYNLGLALYHQGETLAARSSYQEAVRLEPVRAESFYNLGVIHFELGDYELAVECYEQALAIRPDDIDTHYNLAVTRTSQGKLEEAVEHYLRAVALAPEDAELYNALGLVLKQLQKLAGAETCYRKAIALQPDYGAAHTNLAVVMQIVGQTEQAVACYNRAIELGHQKESAAHMLAALTGATPSSAPRVYVRELFDSYADNFDKSLTEDLGYNSPKLLRAMVDELFGPQPRFARVADLGCGTGLVGGRFRDIASHMLGVDLSGKMLAKAAEKGCYDELHCEDLLDFLQGGIHLFDLVIAADVLIYLGDLAHFFGAAHQCLAPDGHLLLTIEKLLGPGDRRLQPSGRYAYSEEYLVNLAGQHGFSVAACQEVDLRKEKGEWLKGSLLALHRMAL